MIKTKTQFAEIMGVHKSTVTRWDKAGRLVLAENGRVKVEESQTLIAATEGGRVDVAERHAKNRGHSLSTQQGVALNATPDDEVDMTSTVVGIGEDRAHYKAVALNAKNQLEELEQSLQNGKRLYKDEFLKSISQQGADIKTALEHLIDNLAPQISVLADPKQRQEKLNTAITNLIDQLN